jgi:hypothetical protein
MPRDGGFPIHHPQMMLDRNIYKEREFLVNNPPIDVVRDGPAYIYTIATGQKLISFYRPGDVQWEPSN